MAFEVVGFCSVSAGAANAFEVMGPDFTLDSLRCSTGLHPPGLDGSAALVGWFRYSAAVSDQVIRTRLGYLSLGFEDGFSGRVVSMRRVTPIVGPKRRTPRNPTSANVDRRLLSPTLRP